jgi:hypothetical protein
MNMENLSVKRMITTRSLSRAAEPPPRKPSAYTSNYNHPLKQLHPTDMQFKKRLTKGETGRSRFTLYNSPVEKSFGQLFENIKKRNFLLIFLSKKRPLTQEKMNIQKKMIIRFKFNMKN